MYRQAVELNPSQFLLRGNYADAMKFAKKDMSEVIQQYQMALEQALESEKINARDLTIKASIARYRSELAQCEQANVQARKIMQFEPDDPYIYYDLALIANNCDSRSEVLKRIGLMLGNGYSLKLLLADPQFLRFRKEIEKLD